MRIRRVTILRGLILTAAIAGSAWLFHRLVVSPLKAREAEFIRRRGELQESLESARNTMIAAKDSDQQVAEARASLNRLVGGKADKSEAAAFSDDLKKHFSQFGFDVTAARLVTAQPEPDLPGYQKAYWTVGVPVPEQTQNSQGLLQAVAELAQQRRYLEITDFSLQPDVFDPKVRMASIGMVVLDKK